MTPLDAAKEKLYVLKQGGRMMLDRAKDLPQQSWDGEWLIMREADIDAAVRTALEAAATQFEPWPQTYGDAPACIRSLIATLGLAEEERDGDLNRPSPYDPAGQKRHRERHTKERSR